jgi:hypothetical protein
MTGIIRKIHIYAGLLTFVQLIVYGIAGLVATAQTSLERPKVPRDQRYVPISIPPNATDRQVADIVYQSLNLPMTRPIPDWFLRRTPDNHLLLDFYNINGIYRVVVLEEQSRVRIDHIRNSTWLFLEDTHAATPGDPGAPKLVRLWGYWNELALWSLLGFSLSGGYLWVATRPRFLWAWLALGTGALSLALLWSQFR